MSNILLFPGGFKPFHDGHLGILCSHIFNLDKIHIDEVKILISKKGRDFIPDATDTYNFLMVIKPNIEKAWNIKVSVEICDVLSPIRKCYMLAGDPDNHDMYSLVSSDKDDDIIRKKDFGAAFAIGGKYYNPEVGEKTMYINTSVVPVQYRLRDDFLNYENISSTIVRSDIKSNDFYNFKCAYSYMLSNGLVTKEILKEYFNSLRMYVSDEND